MIPTSTSKIERYIGYFASIYVNEGFYIIGGRTFEFVSNVVGRFDSATRTWSYAGSLKGGRRGHNAIFDGEQVLIVGGYDTKATEACRLVNSKFVCTQLESSLTGYSAYPELALVDENFGNDCF